jgi:DNA polymerase
MTLNVLEEVRRVHLAHKNQWEHCTCCSIGHLAHHHVFARGTLPCRILFIGIAPGKTENVMGFPFVGKAGRLLDTWLMRASFKIGTDFLQCYAITNLTLCRPTNKLGGANRDPTDEEIRNCSGRLADFIKDIAKPKVIITLGRIPEHNIPDTGLRQFAVIHPAGVLRRGGEGSKSDLAASDKLTAFLEKEFSNGN